MLNTSKFGVGLATAVLLTGCGGGGSSSGSSEDPAGSVTISGRAADGYLSQATVCMDLNMNSQCDSGEPMATTGAGGRFQLELAAGDPITQLVVETIANLTVDEDTGQPIPKAFTLKAPVDESKDEQFVSPITTMVADEIAKGGNTSLSKAKESVAQRLNTSFDVMDDFIAAKEGSDPSTKQNAERLHRVAQVTARLAAEIESQINQSDLDQLGMTKSELLSMISTQIENLVSFILNDVDQSLADENFDPDSLLESPNYDVTPPSIDEPNEPVDPPAMDSLADRVAAAVPANPFFSDTPNGSEAVTGERVHYLDFFADSMVEGRFFYFGVEQWLQTGSGDSGFVQVNEYASRQKTDGVGAEYIPADTSDVRIYHNGTQTAVTIADNFLAAQEVKASGPSLSVAAYDGIIDTTAEFVGIDLGALDSAHAINQIYPEVDTTGVPSAIFPDSARAFIRSEALDRDLYVTSWHAEIDDSFGEGYCSPGALLAEVGSCNLLYGNEMDGEGETPATTLDGLMYPEGTDVRNNSGGMIGFESGGTTYFMALYGSTSDGSGNIRVFTSGAEGEEQVGTGTWELHQTPFRHVRLNLPDGMYFRAFLKTRGGAGQAFLHEHEGYVRAGRFTPAGTDVATYFRRDPSNLLLNHAAAAHVMEVMDAANLLSENPGWSSDD